MKLNNMVKVSYLNGLVLLGFIYEIGDNTDREFIKKKGKVSATSLINVLGI